MLKYHKDVLNNPHEHTNRPKRQKYSQIYKMSAKKCKIILRLFKMIWETQTYSRNLKMHKSATNRYISKKPSKMNIKGKPTQELTEGQQTSTKTPKKAKSDKNKIKK